MGLSFALKELASLNRYIFILDHQRFKNPLIKEERKGLQANGLLGLRGVRELIEGPLQKPDLKPSSGMYFPVSMARAIEQGQTFDREVTQRYHYDFIAVDDKQQWTLRSRPITGKVLDFFQSKLAFEKETERYFVEYWSDVRWDKCYLACRHTPMLALALSLRNGCFSMILNNGSTDEMVDEQFSIDEQERCFAASRFHGLVMLADAPRFWLLSHLDSSGTSLIIEGRRFPVILPAG